MSLAGTLANGRFLVNDGMFFVFRIIDRLKNLKFGLVLLGNLEGVFFLLF